MVEAILMDTKKILPCAAYLTGEYGISGVVLGVPAKLGHSGIEQIMEIELTSEEHAQLVASSESVRKQVETMELGKVTVS
jgi:malate dehydrogenase